MKIQAQSFVHDHVVDEFDHAGLTPGKVYVVIGLSDSCFRVVNDFREPILYPRDLFVVVDPEIPADWLRRAEEEDGYYVDPQECAEPGFYERVFDADTAALAVLEGVLERIGAPPVVISRGRMVQ